MCVSLTCVFCSAGGSVESVCVSHLCVLQRWRVCRVCVCLTCVFCSAGGSVECVCLSPVCSAALEGL